MPPLVNFSSPLFLSHTDPPFIYQYVGDQVKIVQVLGNYPLSNNSNKNNDNSDKRDQNEATVETQTSPITERTEKECNAKSIQKETIVIKDSNMDIPIDIASKDNNNDNTKEYKVSELSNDQDKSLKSENYFIHDIDHSHTSIDKVSEEFIDSSFFDRSPNDDDNVESDDEASFETPISTPKSIRKIKGKYGKNKAPPPPKIKTCESEESQYMVDKNEQNLNNDDSLMSIKTHILETEVEFRESITDQIPITEVLDISNKTQELHVHPSVNLIVHSDCDKESSDKTNTSTRDSKGSSTFGKLFQLPSKLVFWHKTDDKSIPDINPLKNANRKSSIENTIDEFQSCPDLNMYSNKNGIPQIEITEVPIEDDVSGENITSDILEKSDALQKVINAKIENHPEYKLVSLHEEIPTTSKSTDV